MRGSAVLRSGGGQEFRPLQRERSGAARNLADRRLVPRQILVGQRLEVLAQRREAVAERAPAFEQALEHGRELHTLQLRVQREDMAARRRVTAQLEQTLRYVVNRHAVQPDHLVQRRKGCWQLGAGDDLRVVHRYIGPRAARVRTVTEAEQLREPVRMAVHAPAGGAVHLGIRTKDVAEAVARQLHLTPGPRLAFLADLVLPAHVIVGVDADLEALVAHLAHDLGAAPADVWTGQY